MEFDLSALVQQPQPKPRLLENPRLYYVATCGHKTCRHIHRKPRQARRCAEGYNKLCPNSPQRKAMAVEASSLRALNEEEKANEAIRHTGFDWGWDYEYESGW